MIYRLIRDITVAECPWLATLGFSVLRTGTLLYPASDTWSVCTHGGVPVSFYDGGDYFEVPLNAVKQTMRPRVTFSMN